MSPSREKLGNTPSPDELDRLRAFAMRKAVDPEAAQFRADVKMERASGAEPERLDRKELLARRRAVRHG